MEIWDVIVVGGGPAGLSAALMLGRCRRRVLVLDTGVPRNAASHAIHGLLGSDGKAPQVWLRTARKEVAAYGVQQQREEVTGLRHLASGLQVRTSRGASYRARKVLLATGVLDQVPDKPGFAALYGTSVFHCPYCDAWEFRDQPLAAYGLRNRAVPLALNLRTWSQDVILFTDGPSGVRAAERARLQDAGVRVRTGPVARLSGSGGRLREVILSTGERVPRAALFFANDHTQHCTWTGTLGCATVRTGEVITDRRQRTKIPDVFMAGDATADTHFVVVACAHGVKAAVAIHQELLEEDALARQSRRR